jgi:hypothetical protein
VIRKARLLLVPAALGLLITSQWPDIRRYLKLRQLSQGHGHPQNVPLRGRRPTHSARAMANKTARGTSIRPTGEGRRKDRSKITAIVGSWT